MYTRITIYGLIKKSVMPLFIVWITVSLDLELNFNPPVVYSTDCSKAVVPMLVLLFVVLWFILRGDLFCVFLSFLVLFCYCVFQSF